MAQRDDTSVTVERAGKDIVIRVPLSVFKEVMESHDNGPFEIDDQDLFLDGVCNHFDEVEGDQGSTAFYEFLTKLVELCYDNMAGLTKSEDDEEEDLTEDEDGD